MKKVTNTHQIDLALAVWLLQDGYYSGADVAPPGELLSVTTLLKPTRQLILDRLVDKEQETMDVSDMLASRMGHGLHDSVERAWTEGNWKQAMKRLHYPQSVIDQIVINPDPKTVTEDQIPVFLEKRGFLEIGGIVLTGPAGLLHQRCLPGYQDHLDLLLHLREQGSGLHPAGVDVPVDHARHDLVQHHADQFHLHRLVEIPGKGGPQLPAGKGGVQGVSFDVGSQDGSLDP